MSNKKFTNIMVTIEVYNQLKKLGQAGDSFNDVISKLLADKELIKRVKNE